LELGPELYPVRIEALPENAGEGAVLGLGLPDDDEIAGSECGDAREPLKSRRIGVDPELWSHGSMGEKLRRGTAGGSEQDPTQYEGRERHDDLLVARARSPLACVHRGRNPRTRSIASGHR